MFYFRESRWLADVNINIRVMQRNENKISPYYQTVDALEEIPQIVCNGNVAWRIPSPC